jgi:8-oxo-dGTP pyrophosphatase MutT (NUDIX family)
MSHNNTAKCLKCGLTTHSRSTCNEPVTSFGLIVFSKVMSKGKIYSEKKGGECKQCISGTSVTKNQKFCVYTCLAKRKNQDIKFLLVERRDTIAFINLIQGAYSLIEPLKSEQISKFVSDLTCEERFKLLNFKFDTLWDIAGSNKRNKKFSETKFISLQKGLQLIFDRIPCTYKNADYVMMKGRLKHNETITMCALRECCEETGYKHSDFIINKDINPYVEDFIGTDQKSYRNVFYVATIKDDAVIDIPLHKIKEQEKEVRNVGWFTITECMNLLRDSIKKKILLNALDEIVKKVL